MKLTPRERQRAQRWTITLAVVACMLYAYVHLLIQPLVRVRVRDSEELQELQGNIERAEGDLATAAALGQEHARLVTELIVATNRFVLRPTIGALLATCQNLLDPLAAAYGLTTDVYLEKGRQEIPGVKKDGNILFERYAMEVSMQGSYDSLRTFLADLERTNSYVCVTDIDVLGGPRILCGTKSWCAWNGRCSASARRAKT